MSEYLGVGSMEMGFALLPQNELNPSAIPSPTIPSISFFITRIVFPSGIDDKENSLFRAIPNLNSSFPKYVLFDYLAITNKSN